ncbi:MAG: FAD-dependent oxidoreductase, partial [Armatimonadota bacterium]|nr:FAD-dependent oxidoreductase [Armatimonadota bacterium]
MAAQHFDALIIGDGQGGDPLARAFAQAGKTVAVVERGLMGGTCVNTGCTPTKTMAASARVAYLARRAGDYGVRGEFAGVDLARVRQRKRDIVQSFREGVEAKTDK